MKENYNFLNGVKNPYINKIKNGYTVMVHHDFKKSDDIKNENNKGDNRKAFLK